MTSINVGKGLFRLWVVLAVCWVAPLTWVKWLDITSAEQFIPELPYFSVSDVNSGLDREWTPAEKLRALTIKKQKQIDAANLIILPPTLLLLLGFAGVWVLRGFRITPSEGR